MVDPIDNVDAGRNTAELRKIFADSATPYGDLTVVDRDNRIDVSSETPLSDQADNYTAGVTHDPSNSRYQIRANSSTESLETIDGLQYTPGYIAEIGISLQNGYVRAQSAIPKSESNDVVMIHRLVAVAAGKLAPSRLSDEDVAVHHKNGIKWDNRPENLETMTTSEHARLHYDERKRSKTGEFEA